ncbi:nucleotidyltransferase domain-containing protein [Brevibacillus borstelensis]|uniref:nucleotidyltransferase domain-containing protein n=1 Tax=Brevibacillus borstelensis TaxID=45462 RepID=UPI0030BA42CC
MERKGDFTDFFLNLAELYLKQNSFPGMISAYAGGSVGRGEADMYSDLDLNLFLEGSAPATSENRVLDRHVIQLHAHAFPSVEAVKQEPWAFRFVKEARCVFDPDGRFREWKEEAIRFLDSQEGKRKMLVQARAVVDERKRWAEESLQSGQTKTAWLAGVSAWLDAVIMYAWFEKHSLATGKLVPAMRELSAYREFVALIPGMYNDDYNLRERFQDVSAYRRYFREAGGDEFASAEVQDLLLERKLERHIREGDEEAARWLLLTEAAWLYLSSSEEESLDEHIAQLPLPLQEKLGKIGFSEADADMIRHISGLCDEVVETVFQRRKEE